MNINDLYQELIIDHSQHPRNQGELACPTGKAEGYNPLCGDQVTVFLTVENDIITKTTFKGTGCALSVASASLMTEILIGKPLAKALEIAENFKRTMTADEASKEPLGKLEALLGAKHFPARVKCVTLVWHTLTAALKPDAKP